MVINLNRRKLDSEALKGLDGLDGLELDALNSFLSALSNEVNGSDEVHDRFLDALKRFSHPSHFNGCTLNIESKLDPATHKLSYTFSVC
jgi:hypothetical protein